MLTTNEIRKRFLDYFEKRTHKVVSSMSLIPQDPTLLFTSAGMVQFKNMFLGKGKLAFRRAASSQICFRTTDIEEVGNTARHLTFFEMLGNFSFGDYFKKEAIEWAWDFLIKEMGLPQEKLYASVYTEDEEAYELWKRYLPEERVVKLGKEDNFWEMGPTGPCGPCSEVLMDMGEDMGCGKPDCAPGCDCDRWLEVWNLVFTQFDKDEQGNLNPLPQKNIDTGMGLERLAEVVNGKNNCFDIDLLRPIIDHTCELTGLEYGKDEKVDVSLRIIADHVRAITFLISEGVLPSNEGRGYVLRRILRRMVRQERLLGVKQSLLYKLTGKVVEIMGDTYSNLRSRREHIATVTKMEEEKFQETLDAGMRILDGLIKDLTSRGKKRVIPGEEVFRLYDTYGFPLDLTKEIAQERDFSLDFPGFEREMEAQKKRAREAWKGSGEVDMGFYEELKKELGETLFRGYDFSELTSQIRAILKRDKSTNKVTKTEEAKEGEEVEIILTETPFYGEAGGQVGDAGKILKPSGKLKDIKITEIREEDMEAKVEVFDAKRPVEGLVIHNCKVVTDNLKTGDVVVAYVDVSRRQDIARHHTATHLLQSALRQVLGKHVGQSGSLVAPDRLRFDYTHSKPLTKREIDRIEEIVNSAILKNFPVLTSETTLSQAKDMGALAFFGEKYGEKVRTVMVTSESLSAPQYAYSFELCGGIHCRSTGEIGLFKIISETGIAAGVRRIEARAGKRAYQYMKEVLERKIEEITEVLKVPVNEIVSRLEKMVKENRALAKEIESLRGQTVSSSVEKLVKKAKTVGKIKLVSAKVEATNRTILRSFGDQLRDKLKSGIIILGAVIEGKVALLSVVTQDLVKKGYHAGKIIGEVAKLVNGSGGGRPDMAQAGGKSVNKLDSALAKAEKLIPKIKK
ncbi:Alanine--tRNA ligase [subsurface metagenome]